MRFPWLPVVRLDPMTTGRDEAPLEYYEQVMRENIITLREALGRKGLRR